MTFAVDETIFSVMMNYCIGVVIAEDVGDVENGSGHPEVEQLLVENMAEVRGKVGNEPVSQSEPIRPYREAYEKLGMDADQYTSSIEYLINQAAMGREIPMVNPIVDLVTAISLKYLVPMVAYDIDEIDERLDVRFSEEGDTFALFGDADKGREEQVEPGEVVYASGKNVKTRKWFHRRSERGKVRSDTRRLLIPIDGFEGVNRDRVISARDELAGYLSESFGARVATAYLNYAQNMISTEEEGRGQ